jgi:hypothetical protein
MGEAGQSYLPVIKSSLSGVVRTDGTDGRPRDASFATNGRGDAISRTVVQAKPVG